MTSSPPHTHAHTLAPIKTMTLSYIYISERDSVVKKLCVDYFNQRKVKKQFETVFLFLSNRGNFKGWIPYKAGASCASCPDNCEDKLCSKLQIRFMLQRTLSTKVKKDNKLTSFLFLFTSANPCPYINKFLNCPALKSIIGCSNSLINAWCPASCKCPTEIIPVAWRWALNSTNWLKLFRLFTSMLVLCVCVCEEKLLWLCVYIFLISL